jgi:LTXXQ motif family protein
MIGRDEEPRHPERSIVAGVIFRCTLLSPGVTMPRVLVSLAAASMLLVAMPPDAGARSFRSLFRHSVGVPLGIVGGFFGLHHHRLASRDRRGHGLSLAAAPSEVASRPGDEAVAATEPAESSYRPWPSAYDDIFGFVLTPAGNGDAFWRHGAVDLQEALMPAGTGVLRASARARRAPMAAAAAACPQQRPDGIAGWPMDQVERMLKPTDQQRQGLERLHAALDRAFDLAQASCAAAQSASSLDRLEALRKRVAALREAVRLVRPPLDDLYASLSDEQKARLNAASRRGILDASALDARAQEAAAERLLRACAADTGGGMQAVFGQLQQAVQPTADQRSDVEIFAGTVGHMAELLKASCPADMPLTPPGRINAAEKRLRVMLYAITIVRGPLERFYSGLSAEQKARFDAGAGPPGNRHRAELR